MSDIESTKNKEPVKKIKKVKKTSGIYILRELTPDEWKEYWKFPKNKSKVQ